ncbi:tetraspanin-8-like [Erpetoichthys calabaricus]|uniref:tetraspanin-8-like n=1 Tax=Erpetoichthys calabaricus TaxID=27687 RepID=UPI002234446E|nr:tetraspanin-8-like [Erpetoichthys calabaricus]
MGEVDRFLKISLLLYSTLLLASGCAILGYSIRARVNLSGSNELSQRVLAKLLISIGSINVIAAVIACCGAVKENRLILGLFIIGLAGAFVVLIATGVFAIMTKNEILNPQLSSESGSGDGATDTPDQSNRVLISRKLLELWPVDQEEDVVNAATMVLNIIIGIAFGFAVFQLLGILCSVVMCCQMYAE